MGVVQKNPCKTFSIRVTSADMDVCFCCSGERHRKGGKRFAKGLNTAIYKHICYSIHAWAWQFSFQNCHRIHAWDCILHLYNTLTDICIERCRHLPFLSMDTNGFQFRIVPCSEIGSGTLINTNYKSHPCINKH